MLLQLKIKQLTFATNYYIMKIYRIDGNKRCFREPNIGLEYFSTKQKAEKYLTEIGFYLETRKWKDNPDHDIGSPSILWYNKQLSDEGQVYDNTSYMYITEINVN